jgi:hypothetical protein
MVSNCYENKSKNWQMGLHQIKNLVHMRGNSHQNKETMHRTGENICKLFIGRIYTL